MFGSNLLVAPLFAEGDARNVYLPPGEWIDYPIGQDVRRRQVARDRGRPGADRGPGPRRLGDSASPTVAQSTGDIDWDDLELRVFGGDDESAAGHVALPEGTVHDVKLSRGSDGKFQLENDPLAGDVRWRITTQPAE